MVQHAARVKCISRNVNKTRMVVLGACPVCPLQNNSCEGSTESARKDPCLAGWCNCFCFRVARPRFCPFAVLWTQKKKRRNRQFEIAWLPWRPYETVLASLSHGLRSPVQKATLSVQLVIHHRPFSSCNQAAALCFRMLRIEVAHHHAARWAVSGIHCRWKTSHRAVPIVSG